MDKVDTSYEENGDFTDFFVNKKNETTTVFHDISTGIKTRRKVDLEGKLTESVTFPKAKNDV